MASRKLAGSHSLRMGRERMLCPHGIYVYGYGRMGIACAFHYLAGQKNYGSMAMTGRAWTSRWPVYLT